MESNERLRMGPQDPEVQSAGRRDAQSALAGSIWKRMGMLTLAPATQGAEA